MTLNLLAAQGLQFFPEGMEPRGEKGRMALTDHLQSSPQGSSSSRAACPHFPRAGNVWCAVGGQWLMQQTGLYPLGMGKGTFIQAFTAS